MRYSFPVVPFILGILPSIALAATINVLPGGSIQDAINASSSGDLIAVAAGTYNENIDLGGKDISLNGDGPGSSIIDGGGSGTVVMFDNGETSNTIIDGFTIRNGSNTWGGGIFIDQSSPTLTNLAVTGNTATTKGGGIWIFNDSNPTLTNLTVSGNTADYGGGIHIESSDPTLTNLTVSGNSANNGGGLMVYNDSNPTLINMTVHGNTAQSAGGGGYIVNTSYPTLINLTVSGNTADSGGGFSIYLNSNPQLINSILWGNTANIDSDIWTGSGGSITASHSNVTGEWPGTGNINTDPLFVDAGSDDYTLQEASPCVNSGDDSAVPVLVTTDLYGNPRIVGLAVDMGSYESSVIPVEIAGYVID